MCAIQPFHLPPPPPLYRIQDLACQKKNTTHLREYILRCGHEPTWSICYQQPGSLAGSLSLLACSPGSCVFVRIVFLLHGNCVARQKLLSSSTCYLRSWQPHRKYQTPIRLHLTCCYVIQAYSSLWTHVKRKQVLLLDAPRVLQNAGFISFLVTGRQKRVAFVTSHKFSGSFLDFMKRTDILLTGIMKHRSCISYHLGNAFKY